MSDLVVAEPAALAVREGVPWEEVLQVYLDRLSAEGTRRVYETAVREAFAWWSIEAVNDVAPGNLASYRAHLVQRTRRKANDPLSPASVALKLSALRGFFVFCRLTGVTAMSRELVSFTLAGYTSRVVKPYEILSEEEQRQVLDHLRSSQAMQAERDYAMISLMLATGLRAGEVTMLQLHDIHTDAEGDWSVHVRQGKGRKDRMVPLSAGMRKTLGDWLRRSGREMSRQEDKGSFLFWGGGGLDSPMTTRRLQQIVKRAAREAGVTSKVITPHSLRHTMAMRLLCSGASVITVQKLLGHASVQTTQKYLDHLDWRDLKRWAVEL